MDMHTGRDLSRDFQLEYHNVHGKNCHIHSETCYLAEKRMVVQRTTCTKLRFLNFLPPKQTVREETLGIPMSIATESELYRYVERQKPCWLRDRHY